MSVNELILQNEITLRAGFFVAILVCMAIWEVVAPRRTLRVSKALRWLNNLGLVILNSLMLRLIFPAVALGMAEFSSLQS